MLRLPQRYAEQRRKLRQRDDERRRVDEPHQHRVRHKADQHAGASQAERDLEDARKQREQRDIGIEMIEPGRSQRRDARRSQQRCHRDGPGRQDRRRAEQHTDDRGNERRVQPVVRGNAGELRVGKRLRNRNERYRNARQQIVARRCGGDARPAQEGQQAAYPGRERRADFHGNECCPHATPNAIAGECGVGRPVDSRGTLADGCAFHL